MFIVGLIASVCLLLGLYYLPELKNVVRQFEGPSLNSPVSPSLNEVKSHVDNTEITSIENEIVSTMTKETSVNQIQVYNDELSILYISKTRIYPNLILL